MRADRRVIATFAVLVALAVLGTGCARQPRSLGVGLAAPSATPSPSASASGSAEVAAAPAPAGLAVIDYSPAPKGFPADPEPMSTAAPTEGLHPTAKLPVYDAIGGTPRAFLAPTISGVQVTVPIVTRRDGWVAVLVPSVNRTVGWLPSGGWTRVELHDQLIARRQAHELAWYRDGALRQAWTVTIGASATPTPLGRTFVLGRSALASTAVVYAGLDGLALGAVPDRPDSVGTGLRGAHIGIHSWYRNDFGGNKSNGCIRVPKAGQQLLLNELAPGTEIVVLD